MGRRSWLFCAALALSSGGCTRSKKPPAPDAGRPATAGETLLSFDALAPGTVSGYGPRIVTRLGAAKALVHDAVVPMPAGLGLRVAWETRDDLFYGRRYLTSWRVTVDVLAPNVSCFVRSSEPAAPTPHESSEESLSVMLSIKYHCVEGRNTSELGVFIGQLNQEGFTPMALKSGVLKPTPTGDEPPSIPSVHFAPKSAALDAAAKTVIDDYLKALAADAELKACLAYHPGSGRGAERDRLMDKRLDAVIAYGVAHGLEKSRVLGTVGTGQDPPGLDDIEIWPLDVACLEPKTKKRR